MRATFLLFSFLLLLPNHGSAQAIQPPPTSVQSLVPTRLCSPFTTPVSGYVLTWSASLSCWNAAAPTGGGGGSGVWGSITGTLSSQTDLWGVLGGKESTLTFSTGLLRTTNAITCITATTSLFGCLTAADWNAFNSKQAAITTGTTSQYLRGDLTLATFSTGVTSAMSGLYEVPLTFSTGLTRTTNNTVCNTATTSVFGCLTAADWNTFNGKISANQTITVSGDCAATGTTSLALVCTKTNSVAFGTAATVNTGTSGATIPLLNGTNTWANPQALSSTLNKITFTPPTTAWTITPAADNQTTTVPAGTLVANTRQVAGHALSADVTVAFSDLNGTATAAQIPASLTATTSVNSTAIPSSSTLLVNGGALGTPSSGTGTNFTGIPISTGISGLAANVAAFLAAPSGVNFNAMITGGGVQIGQNSQSAAYTTVMGDCMHEIYHPSADTTARTWTIDSNANVAAPIGCTITFANDTSAGVVTIAITTDTLILNGAGTTGSRTLAASGIATATKITSTRWMINGSGLT